MTLPLPGMAGREGLISSDLTLRAPKEANCGAWLILYFAPELGSYMWIPKSKLITFLRKQSRPNDLICLLTTSNIRSSFLDLTRYRTDY